MATLEEIEAGEVEGVEHSLPVHSEIEGETRKSASKRRPTIVIAICILLLVGAIVGLTIGFTRTKKEGSNAAASTSSSQNGSFSGTSDTSNSNAGEQSEDEPSVPVPAPEEAEPQPEEEPEDEFVPEEEPAEEPVVDEDQVDTSLTPEPSTAEPLATERPESIPETEITEGQTPGQGTRLEVIIDFLVDKGVASRMELEMEGTYASMAVNWIANEDFLMLPVPMPNGNRTVWTPLEEEEIFINRYVLAHIYYALGGPKWKHQANFLSEKPSCEWMEIVDGVPIGVGCTPKDGRLRALFLNDNKLQNHLPSEIGLLTDLISLDLGVNFVMGTLPDAFQALTELEHLNLGSAGLTGTLPTWIGTLRNLASLNLGYNVMKGTIPSEITLLPVLRELALDHNAFEGDVNALFSNGGLSSVEELYLDSNTFIGQLGMNFAANMENLTQLDLSDNAFEGQVPEHFFTFPKLEVLDIHDNSFTSLPIIANNTALKFFAAQKNMLVGNIEGIVGLSALTHLDLSQNQLTGSMPESLGESVLGLTYLFLSENNFDPGYIPFSLSNLFSLKELSLKGTSRTGIIPNIMGLMTELVFLDLDNNSLEGTIPSTLGSLTNLQLLLLNRNNLTNEIPSEFAKLTDLHTFFLEGNSITGGLNYTCNSGVTDKEIIAQCSLCDTVEDCCADCCQEGVACNTKIHVADLDPIWQLSYERDDYALDREDLWR